MCSECFCECVNLIGLSYISRGLAGLGSSSPATLSWFLWKVPLDVLGFWLYCPGPYLHSLPPVPPLYIFIPHTASAYSFSSPTPPLPMHLHWPHGYSWFTFVPVTIL